MFITILLFIVFSIFKKRYHIALHRSRISLFKNQNWIKIEPAIY